MRRPDLGPPRGAARASALPWREEERIVRIRRVALALILNALAQGVVVAVRVLPSLLGGDLGDGTG